MFNIVSIIIVDFESQRKVLFNILIALGKRTTRSCEIIKPHYNMEWCVVKKRNRGEQKHTEAHRGTSGVLRGTV